MKLSDLAIAGVSALLAGCVPVQPPETPQDVASSACSAQLPGPTVEREITKDVLVVPAKKRADGTVEQPAVFRKETRIVSVPASDAQTIVVPCADVQTPEFISSLQRALSARALYDGPVTGTLTPATRTAIRGYQAPRGTDTDIVLLSTAREFGLVTVSRPTG